MRPHRLGRWLGSRYVSGTVARGLAAGDTAALMRLLFAFLLLLLPALSAHAEEEVPKPPLPKGAKAEIQAQVAGWLKDLRSESYQVREGARRMLLAKGLQARDLLEAAKDDPDPEVRRTVRAVLARAPAQAAAVQVRPGNFRGIGRLTIHAKNEPLASVLQRVERVVGGRIEPPKALLVKAVTLDLVDKPCYDVIAALATLTATRVSQPFDRSGRMQLVEADGTWKPAPRGAAGPMQITLLEVAATRSFGLQAPPRYALKLRLEWAPFVQVQQYERPTVEVARDPDGKRFRPSPAMARTASYGVGTTVKHHTTTVHIEPAEAGCKEQLGALEVTVPMRLRHGLAAVEVNDLAQLPVCLGPDGKAAKPGTNESVQVHDISRAEGSRGQWVVDFTATLTDEGAQRTLEAFLIEPDGALRRVSVYGGRSIGADGTVRITARAYRGRAGRPKGLKVTWFRREEQGRLRFRLEDIPLR